MTLEVNATAMRWRQSCLSTPLHLHVLIQLQDLHHTETGVNGVEARL
jgi:hypothetical protein